MVRILQRRSLRAFRQLPRQLGAAPSTLWDRGGLLLLVFAGLLPLAMTMALIWKTKEVILDSVFRPG